MYGMFPCGIYSAMLACDICFEMSEDEVEALMNDLRQWASDAQRGDQAELARLLEVPPQRITHWIKGRKIPNLRDGLKLQAFLRKQRGKK